MIATLYANKQTNKHASALFNCRRYVRALQNATMSLCTKSALLGGRRYLGQQQCRTAVTHVSYPLTFCNGTCSAVKPDTADSPRHFQRIHSPRNSGTQTLQKSRSHLNIPAPRQRGDIKHVPPWRPTNIKRNGITSCRTGFVCPCFILYDWF